jgi:O-antigen/teichoic acid export membrane protein
VTEIEPSQSLLTRFLPRGGAREATLLSLSTQLEAVFSFATVIALTRSTSVTRAGQVFFAQALAAVIFLVLDPRLEDALQRYAAIIEHRGHDGAVATLFRRCVQGDILIAGVSGLLVLAGLGIARPSDHGPFVATYLALAIVNGALQAPIGTAMAGYAISGQLIGLGRVRIGIAIVSSVANVVAIVAGGPSAFLAVNALTTGLGMIVLTYGASRRVRTRFGKAIPIERDDIAGIVPFTVKSSIATSVQFGSDQVLYAVAGATGGAAFLAQLRVAAAPGRFVLAAASPAAAVLFPRTSVHAARGDRAAVRSLQERATLRILPFAIAIAVVALAGMRIVLPLAYGNAYRSAADAAALFVIAACVRIAVVWSKVLMLAVGRPGLRLAVVALESVALLVATAAFAAADALTELAFAHVAIAIALAAWWLGILRWHRLVATAPGARARG